MMPSSRAGPDRQDGNVPAPGWYPNRSALGGYAWWTGREWGWPFPGPTRQAAPLPFWPAAAQPRRPTRHSWLVWLTVAYISAPGCAAAGTVLGICLATGRPLDGATSVLLPVMIAMNLVLGGVSLALGGAPMKDVRFTWGPTEAGPPPGTRSRRRVRLVTSLPAWLVGTYCVILLVLLSTLVAWATHWDSGWCKQVCLAICVACQFALLGARALHTSCRAWRQGPSPD